MDTIKVDFSKTLGKVKPMHSVNNCPVYKFAVDQRITNIESYRAAGIPYARTHDASFYATYGGEHIIRHYTEGWADGFNMDIEYWEIWNEPNLDGDDDEHKRCWGGTAKQFYEFFLSIRGRFLD